MSETKKLHVQDFVLGIASGSRVGYHANSIYRPFTAGTSESGVIGNDIDVRYFELRYNVRLESNPLQADQPIFLEMALVRTAQVWGDTTSTIISPSGIPGTVWVQGGTSTWNRPYGLNKFNGDAVRVLKYKRKAFYPNTTNTATATAINNYKMWGGKWKMRMKGKRTFNINAFTGVSPATSGGVLRDNQYYLLVRLESTTAAGSTYNVSITYDTSMYYKDI